MEAQQQQQVLDERPRGPQDLYSGPLDHYTSIIREGALKEDEHQRAVMLTLDQLHQTLRGYSNTHTSLFSRVNNSNTHTSLFSRGLHYEAGCSLS